MVVAYSGIGKVHAAIATSCLVTHFGADTILGVGLCGALSPVSTTDANARPPMISDVFVADAAAYHDVDATALSYPRGQLPQTPYLEFNTDEALSDTLETVASRFILRSRHPSRRVHRGLIVSGDQFISDRGVKTEILAHFDRALCCDMESAAIAHACRLAATRCAILLEVANNADGSTLGKYRQVEKELVSDVVDIALEALGELPSSRIERLGRQPGDEDADGVDGK